MNGLYGAYPGINGYENGEYKPEFLYHYPSNNLGDLGSDLLYNRAPGYSALGTGMYPGTDPYRLDVDKHSYTNGYYLDPHRQYQHTLSYHGNSYADLVSQGSKYAGYGLDTYSLDLAKKVHYNDDFSRLDNEYKKYGYDYRQEWLSQRLNGGIEPVDLRSSSMYAGSLDPSSSTAPSINSSNLFKSDPCQSYHPSKDTNKGITSPDVLNGVNNVGLQSMNHSSVIKSMSSPRSGHTNRCSSVENMNSPNPAGFPQQQVRGGVIHSGSSWAQCVKTGAGAGPGTSLNPSPISNTHSDTGSSPKHGGAGSLGDLGMRDTRDINRNHLTEKVDMLGAESPMTGSTPASVIHSSMTYKGLHER